MGGTNVLSTGVFASAAIEPDRACLPDILCLCCWGRTGVFRRQSQSGARAGLPCSRVNTRKGEPGNYALPEAPDKKGACSSSRSNAGKHAPWTITTVWMTAMSDLHAPQTRRKQLRVGEKEQQNRPDLCKKSRSKRYDACSDVC